MRLNSIFKMMILASMATTTMPVVASEPVPLLLAEVDNGQADVTHYLVSEKLDGVRAFWDGEQLRTRNGNPIAAPAWFTERFPKQELDGELWIGRGEFDRLSAAVRRQASDDAEWRQVRYQVYELPQAPGDFRERAAALNRLITASQVPWLQAVEQLELPNRQALDHKLAEILKLGGEGLMLHRADAIYMTGRSDALLKVKLWYDAEATVIGYQPGKGKYAGMLGALRVRTADGREFMLGTGLTEADRRNPPAIGSLITYRYRELTKRGLPRFASYQRLREI